MRSKSLVLLVLALGCGLVASIGITRALDQPQAQVVVGETKEIFVASVEIRTGEPITPQLVKLENWPVDKIPEGAITELKDLEGRRAKQKLFANEPLITQKLLGKDDKEDVLGDLPPGMRAVAVKVDAVSGGAGLLKPGDYVDVIVHVNANAQAGITTSETVAPKDLKKLKVFAVDSITTRGNDGEQTVVAKTISLIVTPAQAKLVTLSQHLGEIRLVGRNAKDTTNDEDDETTVDFNTLKSGLGGSKPTTGIIEQIKEFGPKPAETVVQQPAPLPETPGVEREVMIIRDGASVREVLFENGKPVIHNNEQATPEAAPQADPQPQASPPSSEETPQARVNPLRN